MVSWLDDPQSNARYQAGYLLGLAAAHRHAARGLSLDDVRELAERQRQDAVVNGDATGYGRGHGMADAADAADPELSRY